MWLKLQHEYYFDETHSKSTWSALVYVNMKVLFMWPLALFTLTAQWEPARLIKNLCMKGCSSCNLKPFLLHKVTDHNLGMATVAFGHPWKRAGTWQIARMKITYFETKIAWYTPSRLQTPFLWLVPSTLHKQKEHQQLAKHQQQHHHHTVGNHLQPTHSLPGKQQFPGVLPLLWFPQTSPTSGLASSTASHHLSCIAPTTLPSPTALGRGS